MPRPRVYVSYIHVEFPTGPEIWTRDRPEQIILRAPHTELELALEPELELAQTFLCTQNI